MITSSTEILEQFIADETSALARNKQGLFYPSNHHRIIPLVARAPKFLPGPARVDLYFHLLRLDHCPTLKVESELALLCEAYWQLKPLFSRRFSACSLPRARGLLLFGEDDRGALQDEPATTLDSYSKHLAFWRYAESFWHMPGMLKKRTKFLALSNDKELTARVRKVLLQMRLCDDLPSSTRLWFWALVFLTIQSKEEGDTVVGKLLTEDLSTQTKKEVLSSLTRYLTASDRMDLAEKAEELLKTFPTE